ncbi:MAG: polysaccharide deacetylase family protein [Bifidobacteriaceae bacterium]|jgi:peptidoglycan/xylan/chitin deacetylase (PgdA/CDA1 family)|nr:polysaccharide deacetylase family protein [Bifidobacteriaceae bacterium]
MGRAWKVWRPAALAAVLVVGLGATAFALLLPDGAPSTEPTLPAAAGGAGSSASAGASASAWASSPPTVAASASPSPEASAATSDAASAEATEAAAEAATDAATPAATDAATPSDTAEAAASDTVAATPEPSPTGVVVNYKGPVPEAPAVDCSAVPCVALTFDDGPSTNTAALLDVLKEKDVKATFFDQGINAQRYPDMIARTVAEGHVIGAHGWAHTSMLTLGPSAACEDQDRAGRAIRDAGAPEPTLVRPPYGSWNNSILAACTGDTFVLWDVDTLDWSSHNVQKITDHVLNETKPGSIVLMHDHVVEDLEVLPAVIDELRARGYTFVTVPELFNTPLAGGQAIYNGPRAELPATAADTAAAAAG